MRVRQFVLILFVLVVGLGAVSCGGRPLVQDLLVQPEVISPNADGTADVARVSYRLSQRASVTMYWLDEQGERHLFRQGVSRPPGEYEALFSGVIDDRLLPDGRYSCVLEAASDRGETTRLEAPLTIQGGALEFIEIRNLSITPTTFSPNRDGIGDRVRIGYYLTKEAVKVQIYLLGPDGTRYAIPEDKIRPFGQVGNHEHDYDAGVDMGAPPPADGIYTVVVEAEDAIGTRNVQTAELRIINGGVPQVAIVNRAAEWSTSILPLGGTLTFTCTVQNVGKVGVRTKGPEPGTTYTTSENFNTQGFLEEPGIFRIGMDYEGNSSGRTYPFRWQLGRDDELTVIDGQKYLMPGQVAMVVGHLRIVDQPVKITPRYWIGLIHEQVWIVEDYVESTPVTIEY